jgi:hypothetical protein
MARADLRTVEPLADEISASECRGNLQSAIWQSAICSRTVAVALLLLALAATARADSASLALRGTPTSGGGGLSAGGYALVGSIGQPLAGRLAAGDFQLEGGLIAPDGAADGERLHLPLLRR